MDTSLIIPILQILSLLIAIVFVFFMIRKANKIKDETEKDLDDINKIIRETNKKLGVTIDENDLKNDK